MRNHGYQNYFDDEVLAASPLKLIQLLYGAALDSIAAARRHVRQKNISARTRSINKAIGLVSELSGCLNHEADVLLCRNCHSVKWASIRAFATVWGETS